MADKTYASSWECLASSINWDIGNTNRFNEVAGKEYNNIQVGRRICAIISIASVIEGCLRTYLILKIEYTRKEKDRIERIIKGLREGTIDSVEPFSLYETPEYYNEKIEELNCIFDNLNRKPQINEIDKKTWGDLKKTFHSIHNDMGSEELSKDIDYLFHYRNFLVHSNLISLQVNEASFNYKDMSLKLSEYLEEKNIDHKNLDGNKYFIEELLPERLIQHFNKCMNDFLKIKAFQEIPMMANLIKSIYNR